MVSYNWKENEIEEEFQSCDDLQSMISYLERKFSEKNQLVCEIRVDGLLLDDEDEKKFSKTKIEEIKSINVLVSSLEDIIDDVCLAFLECVPSLEETSLKAADFFRDGENEKAQNVFSALLEGCQWLVDTLMHVRRVEGQCGQQFFVAREWKKLEKRFAKTIRQVLLAFEGQDYNLMADILEYEMTEVLREWPVTMRASGIDVDNMVRRKEKSKESENRILKNSNESIGEVGLGIESAGI